MPYTIRYYRDPETAQRYAQFGGLDKPPGYQIGCSRYDKHSDAFTEACHINRAHPVVPAVVITVTNDGEQSPRSSCGATQTGNHKKQKEQV